MPGNHSEALANSDPRHPEKGPRPPDSYRSPPDINQKLNHSIRNQEYILVDSKHIDKESTIPQDTFLKSRMGTSVRIGNC